MGEPNKGNDVKSILTPSLTLKGETVRGLVQIEKMADTGTDNVQGCNSYELIFFSSKTPIPEGHCILLRNALTCRHELINLGSSDD